jgi:hypothetical protein
MSREGLAAPGILASRSKHTEMQDRAVSIARRALARSSDQQDELCIVSRALLRALGLPEV